MGYCSGLDAYGHKDWRVPTKAELNVLFVHQASLGGFDVNGFFFPAGSYWSSTLSQRSDGAAWLHNFKRGTRIGTARISRAGFERANSV